MSCNFCSTIVRSQATARSMIRSGIAKHEGYLKAIKPSDVNTTKQGRKKAAAKIDDANMTVPFLGGAAVNPFPLHKVST